LRKRKEKGERKMKRLMAIVLIVAMLGMIVPMFPVSADLDCMSYPIFEVLVEGKTSWIDFVPDELPIKLKEMTYGKGSTFTVEVWIRGVEDMFAYEFTLTWGGSKYWLISAYTVEDVWPSQAVVMPDLDFDLNKLGLPTTASYTQVVSALPPSTGVSGDIKLATLTFYIHTDIAYHEPIFKTTFDVTGKVSDSCSQEIDLCDPHYALVKFYPAEPDIEIRPNTETNSAFGPHEKFTKEIWVSDITKMKSLTFDLRWNKNVVVHDGQVQNHSMVELHVVEFDTVNLAHADVLDVSAVQDYVDEEGIIVDIKIKCTAAPLRGTFRVMTLTFVKLDPWPCGKQPDYTYSQMHKWTPENATCMFYFYKGYFDVLCPDLAYIYFGEVFNSPLGDPHTYNWGETEFWVCDDVYSGGSDGGGSVRLTTNMVNDYAAVTVPVGGVYVDNITQLSIAYKTISPHNVGPKMFVTLGYDPTVETAKLIAITTGPAPANGAWSAWTDVGAFVWDVYRWDGIDLDTVWAAATVAGLTWATLKTQAFWATVGADWEITMMGAIVGPFPNWAAAANTGAVDVDCFRVTGNLNNPYTIDTDKYNLEPPCQTSKWFDAGFYATLQKKIVNLYTFVPLPGDLNRDGCVDIVDVMIIASMYGQTTYPAIPFYDFSVPPDGDVDIFDIVVVTKHFGLECA